MNEVWIAAISFAGTLIGTMGGIMISSKLTNFRLEQLEKKVEKHNNVVQRTYFIEEQLKTINHKLENIEK